MVFSSYNSASYLPLDSDQSVTFYKNENLLFPPPPPTSTSAIAPAVVCRRNSPVMLTANGADHFGRQPPAHHGSSMCDDFQPVAHLSSNGYYGYIPVNSMPKMMSTEAVNGTANGIGVLLDCHPSQSAAASVDDSAMDCAGANEMENYHHQASHLRKRKEYSDEVEANCKRRKTWLEQPTSNAGTAQHLSWTQAPVQPPMMECQDQPMEPFPRQSVPAHNGAAAFTAIPSPMNGTAAAVSNGFGRTQQSFHCIAPPQQSMVLQPKSKYTETSRCMMSHMI